MGFFKAIGNFFMNLFTTTSWVQDAKNALALIAPLTNTIITLTAGESNAAEVSSVINEIQTDLGTVGNIIGQANSSATVINVLNVIKNNLSALLSAGHIKNAVTLTKVTSIVNTIIGEIEAVISTVSGK